MTFFAFGLNHETAPLPVREAYALEQSGTEQLYDSLALSPESEFVVLSTCNRTEGYLYGTHDDLQVVRYALARASGHSWPAEHAFCFEDEAAITHVLEVAAGLRSMIVGDIQILAQMKEAYRLAVEYDRVGTVLHRLMHTAFRTAKRVVTSTGIGSGAASVSSAAVALARTHFGGTLEGKHVVLLGSGEVGKLVMQALHAAEPATVTVCNRSRSHAEELLSIFPATISPWRTRHQMLHCADLVLVATASDKPVLTADALEARAPAGHETLVIDLAVPRNVDPQIDTLVGYQVLDMDALDARTREVEAARRLELPKGRAIVDEELAEYVTWMFHREALQPAIQAIRDTFEEIRQTEIDRNEHRFADTDREQLDALTKSIMQKLLAVPIVRLKASDPSSADLVRGVKLLQSFFSRPDCEDDGVDRKLQDEEAGDRVTRLTGT